MNFIKLKDGPFINPAQVVSYEDFHNGSAKFVMTTGEYILGKPVNEDFEEAFYPIIPAQAGFYSIYADAQEDLTRHWSLRAIVGWQIAPGGNYPIVQGHATGNYPVGHLEPDGTCVDIDGNRFDNLEVLKAAIAEEDAEFLAKAKPVEQSFSTPFKIANTYLIDPDGERILMVAAHALEGGWSLPFGIIIESHDQSKQENGQAELSCLCAAVGIAELTDTDQLIGKFAVIHSEKVGRVRFSVYEVAAQAA